MQEVAAYSTLAMTVGLVVARPRLGSKFRITPALAAIFGVLVMAAIGALTASRVLDTAVSLWRSFLAIACIMIMTESALALGVLDWWASRVEARARSLSHLFALVFLLAVITAATLNNDAAILLLTPLVVRLIRRRHPERPDLVIPFAFAVFMAAGVAPLVVSNPMNMVVADFSGISFNAYAARMIPIAIAGWAVAFAILRWSFRHTLARPAALSSSPAAPARSTRAQRLMVILLLTVLLGYGVVGYLGGPVWSVALTGAVVSLILAWRDHRADPLAMIRDGVSWQTLAFLLCIVVLSMGLFHVGLVTRMSALYETAGPGEIGVVSALGSAVLNNHPMAYLNMLALDAVPSHGMDGILAALIGGDVGPRLLPMGSLAGLLWMDALRRQGVSVRLRQFVGLGVLVTIPTLAVSLGLLTVL